MTREELLDEENALEQEMDSLQAELVDMENQGETDTPEYEQLCEEINDIVNDLGRIERELQDMDQ